MNVCVCVEYLLVFNLTHPCLVSRESQLLIVLFSRFASKSSQKISEQQRELDSLNKKYSKLKLLVEVEQEAVQNAQQTIQYYRTGTSPANVPSLSSSLRQ